MTTIQAKTILNELLDKKAIKVGDFLALSASLDNYALLEDFLIFCIREYKIKYENYPICYKKDIEFLKKICKQHPVLLKELVKADKFIFNKLLVALTSSDIKQMSINLHDKEINKIIKYQRIAQMEENT